MARSFPADVRLQHFFEEQYAKESGARLDWYLANKRGQATKTSAPSRKSQSAVNNGLPNINPMQYALKAKRQEEEMLKEIAAEARKKFNPEEMRPARREVKSKLYDGFTKEGKGRYAYLNERHRIIPEEKFTFPTLSSMRYGWKLDDAFTLKRPTHARTRLIKDSFYTRNNVPDLPQPSEVFERSYTIA